MLVSASQRKAIFRNISVIAAQNFCSERVAPIFKVSSVTGDGLDNLKVFFNLLQPRIPTGKVLFR